MDKQQHPIQLGETIEGTNLTRRWQGKREIQPVYVPPKANMLTGHQIDCAFGEALRKGYHSVLVEDTTYVNVGGSWYAWSRLA